MWRVGGEAPLWSTGEWCARAAAASACRRGTAWNGQVEWIGELGLAGCVLWVVDFFYIYFVMIFKKING
jgi:hypothetical protein